MSLDPETARIVRSWLDEGVTQLPDRVLDAVLDQVPATAQRRATWWPVWRTRTMNRIVTIGIGAAAVLLAVVVGAQLLGSPNGGAGGPADSASTPEPPATDTTASPTSWTGLPQGPYGLAGADGVLADGPVQITVDVASPGWTPDPGLDYVYKNDDGLDAPQTVGAALIGWSWRGGTEFLVYEDPCRWSGGSETPVTTPEEIATAFLSQAETSATTPVDITVGGYAGKAVTLTVPMSYEVPGATREEEFADCDEDTFTYYGIVGADSAVVRNAQGPGQVDELWILDVEGSIVILDVVYSPSTPPALVAELRALAESATFEVP